MSVDVTTFHYDNARTGANLQETTLTPANVNSNDFGKVGFFSTDGKVDAQPLYLSNVTIPNHGTHNVVYVATENDSLYAFDADDGELLWHDGPSGTDNNILPDGYTPFLLADFPTAAITDRLGILDTPVIDKTTNTLYVVASSQSKETGVAVAHHQILAIDTTTGAIKARRSIDESITFPGTNPVGDGVNLVFHPEYQKERVALTLVNGVVYTGWTALVFGPPYTGWLIGFHADDLSVASVLNINPDGTPVSDSPAGTSGADFWNSGDGFAVDAAGNLFDTTSNGPFDASKGNYGDSFLKISTADKNTTITDYFTPYNQQFLADKDIDFGSSGVIVLPDMVDASGHTVQLAISGSKGGAIYIVDRNNLGGYDATANSNYQFLDNALGAAEANSPSYYNGTVYFGALGQPLTAWKFTAGKLSTSPTSSSANKFSYPGTSANISANGDTDGIAWAVYNDKTNAVLYAYDANDLTKELYDSNQAGTRDQFGPDKTFINPMIANGKVYIGTPTGVVVFGLLPQIETITTTPPPPPPATPPSFVVPAFSSPNPTVGGFDLLGAVGTDAQSDESTLTYTWATIGTPVGALPPIFNANGSNASKLVAVTVSTPGDYTFQVLVTDPAGQVATSTVTVTINPGPTPPGFLIPAQASPNQLVGGFNVLGALGSDADSPETSLTYTWTSIGVPPGAITPFINPNATNAGKLVAVTYASPGVYTFQVAVADPSGMVSTSVVSVFVGLSTPTFIVPAFSSSGLRAGKSGFLGAVGTDPVYGEGALTYTWSTLGTPAKTPAPTFSVNGSNAAKVVSVHYAKAGLYSFKVTTTNPIGVQASSIVVVSVAPARKGTPVKKAKK